jgi:hypothetical protein
MVVVVEWLRHLIFSPSMVSASSMMFDYIPNHFHSQEYRVRVVEDFEQVLRNLLLWVRALVMMIDDD